MNLRFVPPVACLAMTLAGCGGGGGGGSHGTHPYAVPAPIAGPWAGHYAGTVTIGGEEYFGEALVTPNGQIRVYVGGPHATDGSLLVTKPPSSAVYVGTLNAQGTQATPDGEFIGVGCSIAQPEPFCDGTLVNYGMQLTLDTGAIQGSVDVMVNSVRQTWLLDLQTMNDYYAMPASSKDIAGTYTEQLADFAGDGDTVITIDSGGLMFFQSATSGCTGNGVIQPPQDTSADASANVYPVSLTIENCSSPYDYDFYGTFQGFATPSPSAMGSHDVVLRIWLARQSKDFYDPSAALMMSATPQ
jgi:hypothetical protein